MITSHPHPSSPLKNPASSSTFPFTMGKTYGNPPTMTNTPTTQEQIAELQRQIENLRHRAIMELKVKLAEARNQVIDLQNKIAELSGNSADSATAKQPASKARISVTIQQIAEAIKGGKTNYRAIAEALGCSPSNVANKIRKEGKKAGISSKGNKSNFILLVKEAA